MRFTFERIDKLVIFTIKNEKVDGDVSAKFKAEILILCQPDIDALVIDFSNVQYIDSSGLGALLLAHRQLKDHMIPVILVGVEGMVRTMLEISQIEDLFEFYNTVDEVVEDFQTSEFDEDDSELY